jgi:hypothetical protein
MAAAPRNGVITFKGQSGNLFSWSYYVSDVLAGLVTFNKVGTAGTGSTNFIIMPENAQIVDIAQATGVTDTTAMIPYIDDAPLPAGAVISAAAVVNTLPARAFPPVKLRAGRKFQLVQA